MITREISAAQKASTTRTGANVRKSPFWWNYEIDDARRQCVVVRRRVLRTQTRRQHEQIYQELREGYREKKKELKRLINISKKNHWKQICDKLENDIWGDGYKIVTKHLTGLSPAGGIPVEQVRSNLQHLFPPRNDGAEAGVREDEVPPFTANEINEACTKLKSGTAPSPDGIPAELIKDLNDLLRVQKFPTLWKTARVVLIPKPGKTLNTPEAYRPICLLDALG